MSMSLRSGAILAFVALVAAQSVSAQSNRSLPSDPEILEDHYRLAEALRQNDSVPDDVAAGMQLHAELVAAGYVPSLRRLAEGHLNGIGVEQDRERAIELLRLSLASGDGAAKIWLGRALIAAGGNSDEAHALLTEAAAAGLPRADFHLARAHVRGDFGALSDPAVGIEILTALSEAGDISAAYELATAYRQGPPSIADPERARAIFQALVDGGDARSGEELGEMYRDGVGGEADPERANMLFAWSFANGRPQAAEKQIELLISTGRLADARAVAVERAASGEPGAQLDLALADVSETYGAASQRAEAITTLSRIAANPELTEALNVVAYLGTRSLPIEVDTSEIVAVVDEAARGGDQRAAEALIQLSRLRPELFENALETRSALLAQLGSDELGAGRYFEESVRTIAETTTGASGGPSAVEVLAAADSEGLRAGLLAAYEFNRNLYVYLLQDAMRQRGFFDGDLDGVASGPTMGAIMDLCTSGGIYNTCAVGPLGEDAAVALADMLAKQRLAES